MRSTSRSSSRMQRAPAIGHLDHGQRLDEQRGAAGRLVVHDAGHLAARLGADRNDVAAGALGHDRILDDVAEGRRGHDLAQARDQPIVGAAQLGPDARRGPGWPSRGLRRLRRWRPGCLRPGPSGRSRYDLGKLEQRGRLVAQRGQAAPPGARRATVEATSSSSSGPSTPPTRARSASGPHVVDAAQVQAGPQPGQLQRFGRGGLAPAAPPRARGSAPGRAQARAPPRSWCAARAARGPRRTRASRPRRRAPWSRLLACANVSLTLDHVILVVPELSSAMTELSTRAGHGGAVRRRAPWLGHP